jgi:long-subunit acyl-CoA synthetase (AMP-forming)
VPGARRPADRLPLKRELGHFLRGAGITIMEGWGLTETTGLVTMNPPAVQRIGSAGLPLPGCAVRIAPDGEVKVQGPVVFQGYWHDPQATSEVFDGRWLRTGDLGRLDDDGFLDIEECVGDRRPYTAVSRAEGIKRFHVLPAGFAVGAELTQTQKIRRDYVLAKFATDVEALYS